MGVIEINYETLTLIAILLFAAVGFTRGWIKEGVTMLLLMFLVGLLYKPELVEPVVVIINGLLKVVRNVVLVAFGMFNKEAAQAASAEAQSDIFLPDNPYTFLIWALVILIALSYISTRVALKDQTLSPLSRILGGLAGAINGFIAVSLFKEFLLNHFRNLILEQGAAVSVQSAGVPSDGVFISVQSITQESFLQTVGPMLAALAGVMIILLILSSVFNWNLK